MKRTVRFAADFRMIECHSQNGVNYKVPLVPGIFKHPDEKTLREVLRDPDVLRKYTVEALRRAAWPVLRKFPPELLLSCLEDAALPEPRRKAILFLLGQEDPFDQLT